MVVTTFGQLPGQVLSSLAELLPAHSFAKLYFSGNKALARRLEQSVTSLNFAQCYYLPLALPPAFFGHFPHLVELRFAPNDDSSRLSTGEDLFRELPTSLTSFTARTRRGMFDFTANTQDSTTSSPEELVSRFPHLRHLELAISLPNAQINHGEIHASLYSLSHLHLQSLHLSEVPISPADVAYLPPSLQHLSLYFNKSQIPCGSAVFPDLVSLFLVDAPASSDFLAAHPNLTSLRFESDQNDLQLDLGLLLRLSRYLKILRFAYSHIVDADFARALPSELEEFKTMGLSVTSEALEFMPPNLLSLELSHSSPILSVDVSKLPKGLTVLKASMIIEESQVALLPRGLKELPTSDLWNFSSAKPSDFASLPPGLELLCVYYIDTESLLMLKCSKTLVSLKISTAKISPNDALVLSRFTSLLQLSVPRKYFLSFAPHLRPLPLLGLEISDSDDSAISTGYRQPERPQPEFEWIRKLPRTLKILDAPSMCVDLAEFTDLPPKLEHLKIKTEGRFCVEDIADLPRSLSLLQLSNAGTSMVFTTVAALTAAIPASMTSLSIYGLSFGLSDPPHDLPAVLLRPIARKCPGMTDIFLLGEHPTTYSSKWYLGTEIKNLISKALPETKSRNFWFG